MLCTLSVDKLFFMLDHFGKNFYQPSLRMLIRTLLYFSRLGSGSNLIYFGKSSSSEMVLPDLMLTPFSEYFRSSGFPNLSILLTEVSRRFDGGLSF